MNFNTTQIYYSIYFPVKEKIFSLSITVCLFSSGERFSNCVELGEQIVNAILKVYCKVNEIWELGWVGWWWMTRKTEQVWNKWKSFKLEIFLQQLDIQKQSFRSVSSKRWARSFENNFHMGNFFFFPEKNIWSRVPRYLKFSRHCFR